MTIRCHPRQEGVEATLTLVLSCRQQLPAHRAPGSLALKSGMPLRQFCLVPQVVEKAAEGELGAVSGDAFAVTARLRHLRPAWHLGQREVELEDCLPCVQVFSDRTSEHLPQAGELCWWFVRRAVRRVITASLWHSLDDVAVHETGHIHLDALTGRIFPTKAAWAQAVLEGIRDGFRETRSVFWPAFPGNLVSRWRHHVAVHGGTLTARAQPARGCAVVLAWAPRPDAGTGRFCRRP